MIIRKAGVGDLDAVVALRIESEKWLHEAGIRQWIDRELGVRNIRNGITAGTTYVVENESGTVVASLTLGGHDPDFWTESDNPRDALYLYKFMIGATYRGTGLGDELLDWSCYQAEQCGKHSLRLDCWRENTDLQRYYLERGFKHVRTVVVEGRNSGALFERPSTLRTTTTRLLCSTAERSQ